MKKVFSILVWFVFLPSITFADFNYNNYYLSIAIEVPPALIMVTDANGNIAGIDMTKPINQYGQGSDISEIPGSDVDQENISSDEPPLNQPQAETDWVISVADQPAQTYAVSLVGTAYGTSSLDFFVGYKNQAPTSPQTLKVIIEPGVTRTANVSFDPQANTLRVTAAVTGTNFLQDNEAACNLGEISPPEACEVLEVIATEVEKSITQGNTNAEAIELNLYQLVLSQLHNWSNAGSIQNWKNFDGYSECLPLCNKGLNGTIFFANDPAYSALQLDAQTLLNALPNQGISQGGGNQGGNQGGQGQGSSNQGGGNQGGSNEGGQGNNGGSNQGGGNQGNQGSGQGSNGNQGGQENQGGGNQGNH